MVCAHLVVCSAAFDHICCIFDRNREGKRTTCGAAQFSVCSLSLCRAAGCAYLLHLLLQSVEHKELKDELKGSESLFFHPHAAQISSSHPGPPQLLYFLQPMLTFILSLFADVGICWFQNLLTDPLLMLTPLNLTILQVWYIHWQMCQKEPCSLYRTEKHKVLCIKRSPLNKTSNCFQVFFMDTV